MRSTISTLYLLFAFSIFGCSDDTTILPDTSPPKDGAGVDKQAGDINKGPDSAPVEASVTKAAQVVGKMQDEQGTGVSASIIICTAHECQTETANANGSFTVLLTSADDYIFHVSEEKHGAKLLGSVAFRLTVSATDVTQSKKINVGNVVMVTMGPVKKLTSATINNAADLDLGNGMMIKIAANSAKLPPLTTDADVAGAVVAKKNVHPKLLSTYTGTGDPVAIFLFVPARVSFKPAAAFELPITGVTAGTKLSFYGVDEDTDHVTKDTGKILLHGEAEVDSTGKKIIPLTGNGFSRLGWYFFYKK